MQYQTLWTPSHERVADSAMYHFMQHVNARFGKSFLSYDELWQWSVDQPADFWETFWQYGHLKYSQGFSQVVDDPKKMPGARWFSGARLNFAENLLQRRDDHPAIIFRREDGSTRTITFNQLYSETNRIADGLKKLGVVKGDRIASFMPNIPETVIAMLATASIGAI